MDDQFDCLQSFKIKLIGKKFKPRIFSSRPHELDINFKFYCKVKYSRWALHDPDSISEQLTPLGHYSRSSIEKAVRISTTLEPQALCQDEITKQVMDQKLGELHLTANKRRELIDYACEKATKRIVKSKRPKSINNYVMDVDFRVIIEHDHIFVDPSDTEMDIYVDESRTNFMVPAEESTVRSLKRKAMSTCGTETTNCSICLEELSDGSEALCMPCSHFFHSNCIIQWLRTSHYCPICRFQMPTS